MVWAAWLSGMKMLMCLMCFGLIVGTTVRTRNLMVCHGDLVGSTLVYYWFNCEDEEADVSKVMLWIVGSALVDRWFICEDELANGVSWCFGLLVQL